MSGCAATIRQATPADAAAWSQLRVGLWPDADDPLEELAQSLADPEGAVFLACAADGEAVGFAEVRLRHDHVNGTGSSPVGFLEGWYVTPQWQGRAVGRACWRKCRRGRGTRAAASWPRTAAWRT